MNFLPTIPQSTSLEPTSFKPINNSENERNLSSIDFFHSLFMQFSKTIIDDQSQNDEIVSRLDIDFKEEISSIVTKCWKDVFSFNSSKPSEFSKNNYEGDLSLKFALHFLLETSNQSNVFSKKCLEYLSKETGLTMGFNKSEALEIKIDTINDKVEDIYRLIAALDPKVRQQKVYIEVAPKEQVGFEEAEQLIERYGENANSLVLINSSFDDNDLFKLSKKCQNINKLFIKNNKINHLPKFPLLTTLDCGGCSSLKKLPLFQHLTTLNCSWCSSLEELPLFQHLTTLNCSWCRSLKKLPLFPHLTTLDCRSCQSLEELPLFQLLTTLDCGRCVRLKKLPPFPHLTTLDCCWCQSLEELPLFPHLTTLDCNMCDYLKKLSLFPHLTILNCYGCYSLEEIPLFPHLTNLWCGGCWSLKKLPLFPHLTNLDCGGCYSLKKLPLFPDLKALDCSRCGSLKELPEKLPEGIQTIVWGGGNSIPKESLFIFLLHVLKSNQTQYFKLNKIMKLDSDLLQNFSTYFSSDKNKDLNPGQFRRDAFIKYPFLFSYFKIDKNEVTMGLPKTLDSAIDRGQIDAEISKYYGVATKVLQELPLSYHYFLPPLSLIDLLKAKVLKKELLPGIRTVNNSVEELSDLQNNVKGLKADQVAFCDLIGGCLKLAQYIGFTFSVKNPETFPEFLTHLLQATAQAKVRKPWKDRANLLPKELLINQGKTPILDCLDDFAKTIFLPYAIKNLDQPYQNGEAERVYTENRLKWMTDFLDGIPIDAIIELSNRWHDPRTRAQLNKAKTLINMAWKPLFIGSKNYEKQNISAFPLTTTEELKKEGEDLEHCVEGYTQECLKGKSHIISLRNRDGESLSTIELRQQPGKGSDNDLSVINIDGENDYHLILVQHYGKRNSPPSDDCKEVAKELFDDIRHKRLEVNLRELEAHRQKRVDSITNDVTLIGYDPTDSKSFEKAKKIYMTNGIGNISYGNTFRSNIEALTGGLVKKSENIKKNKNSDEKSLNGIRNFYNGLFGENTVEISIDKKFNKPHGAVCLTLKDQEKFDKFNKHIIETYKSPEITTGDSILVNTKLTPRNLLKMINSR